MKRSLTLRHFVLGAGLAASLAAAGWVAQGSPEEADLALPRAAPARHTAIQAPSMRVASTDKLNPDEASRDMAQAIPLTWDAPQRQPWPAAESLAAWSPPAPPPPPPPPRVTTVATPAPPPVPVAPTFPYQLIGRLETEGTSQALMSGPLSSISVKAGDVIDGQWRVEQVDANSVRLTWLPAKLVQTIVFRPS